MPPEDLEKFLRPFTPFRIKLSTGEVIDMYHPELVMAGKRSVTIGITNDPMPRYDKTVTVALLHIVRLEPLDAPAASGSGQ